MARKPSGKTKSVDTLTHDGAKRSNIPTAEFEALLEDKDKTPIELAYQRRNRDLDPQLVWRGKDQEDEVDLEVSAPPLFIQEKVHPKVLIDALLKRTDEGRPPEDNLDLFHDFNGLPDAEAKTEFYAHNANWTNRMILGDALKVMGSLSEREGLKGKVQAIYLDPPYGIKFNSNFQWSTTSNKVQDGKSDHITREPEQVKAFRDTWRDGIHTYLSYLRDRMTVARDLLTESGSIFVQIGDENVHRVRALMDEVFGEENFVSEIILKTTSGAGSPTGGTTTLAGVHDYVLWYASSKPSVKYRQLFFPKTDMQTAYLYKRVVGPDGEERAAEPHELDAPDSLTNDHHLFRPDNLTSQSSPESATFKVHTKGLAQGPGKGGWKTNPIGMKRLEAARRIFITRNQSLQYQRRLSDFNVAPINDVWTDVGTGSFTFDKVYVVQTNTKIVQRCLLMTTDPGDLVLDPTCGSGTTAYVAEQWGRRWITIDTSRVALALARARLMGARYPWYILKDSGEGLHKEGELTRTPPKDVATYGDIRQGFVYDRVPHITLKAIANNTEIDEIWAEYHPAVEAALSALNAALRGHGTPFTVETGGRKGETIDFTAAGGDTVELPSGEDAPAGGFLEWEVPREVPDGAGWPAGAHQALERFWEARIARQAEIDKSIAAKADQEFLYDRPFEDKSRVRVAGPFTVESLSPHKVLAVDADDELIDVADAAEGKRAGTGVEGNDNFTAAILENLKAAGIQQADKSGRIKFSTLEPWPGEFIGASGTYEEGETAPGEASKGDRPPAAQAEPAATGGGIMRRAAVLIGPEYGTLARADLMAAAREAVDAGFDILIVCAFNFDAHAGEVEKLGRLPILKARMNPDLHMAGELKTTGSGNLFVVFGEPDIDLDTVDGDTLQITINGVDVFKPQSGEVVSSGPEGIACWFVDDDYDEESFFVRHAYFLGAGDPYKALKTTLKAEIDPEAWDTLYSATSRPFPRPKSGRIAVKVINHLGDEVMKVFEV